MKTKRQSTEDRFYNAVVRLMGKKDYASITVTDIAAEAGLSRMTFYRHYREVDDVLINHLRTMFKEAEQKISNRRDLTRRSFWLELVRINREDPINKHLKDAGLLAKSFNTHLELTTGLFKSLFGVDSLDFNTELQIYEKLGAVMGCIFYVRNHKDCPDEVIAEKLISIVNREQL